ncbi:MAG: hypothetical protein AAFN77_01155 [Planctomycetota bacterium]
MTDTNNQDENELKPVSEQAELRRAEMLPQLHQAMREYHAQKRKRRLAMSMVAVASVVVAWVAITWWPSRQGPSNSNDASIASSEPITETRIKESSSELSSSTDHLIATNREQVAERLVCFNPATVSGTVISKRKSSINLKSIDDGEMLELLADHGHESFIATVGGEKIVVRAD